MHKKELRYVKEKISVLLGLPFHKVTRAADMLCLHIGQMIEAESPFFDEFGKLVKDKDGKFKMIKVQVAEYALHLQCFYRISCGNHIILANYDRYEPSSAMLSKPDFNIKDFDYDTIGNNRLDEMISTKLSDLKGFIIETVKISTLGDIIINFNNGFLIEGYISSSNSDECWRFFKCKTKINNNSRHLVITGKGIEGGNEL